MGSTYSGWRHGKEAKLGRLDVLALGSRAFLENPPPNHGDDTVEEAGILACQLDPLGHVGLHAHPPEVAPVHCAIGARVLAETLDTSEKASKYTQKLVEHR